MKIRIDTNSDYSCYIGGLASRRLVHLPAMWRQLTRLSESLLKFPALLRQSRSLAMIQ